MDVSRRFYVVLVAFTLLLTGEACDRQARSNTAVPAGAQTKAAATDALPTGNGPYDILARTYAPYTSSDDPVGFPMKVRNLAKDNYYRFWRGSKELFYEWCKTNIADWMADQEAYLRIHGDLHPGNMGLYHSKGKFGHHVAFGAVDFDDSARLPFQIELLQGVITMELLASHRRVKMTDERVDQMIATLLDSYKTSLQSDQTPTQMLEEDNWVGKLLKTAGRREYSTELTKYLSKDKKEFVSEIIDRDGRIKEVLRGLKGRGGFADAITDALLNSPDGKDVFKDADIRKKDVEDIARRTQLESAGSEGLHKYLVLLNHKKSPEGKLILYLKQVIPSSAERVGLIPKDARPPSQRSSEDMHDLSNPPAYFNSWCTWNGGSYVLSIKEPWSETMDGNDVNTFEDLKHMARIWGIVAGSAHRQQGNQIVERIKSRLTPELSATLRERAAAYTAKAMKDFEQFRSDPRTTEQVKRAEAGLRELESKAR
jgi:uncharacterized protein (DUF2252 family)